MLPRRSRPLPPKRQMYVAFVLGGEDRVLSAERVAAVGELGPVVPLPTENPRLLGLTVHQGRVVALTALAGTAARDQRAAASHLVVLRAGGGCIAFAVERLIGLKVAFGEEIPDGFSLMEEFADPSLAAEAVVSGAATS